MTLDELAEEYPVGRTVRFRLFGVEAPKRGEVLGVCYSLPKEKGGSDEPALVIRDIPHGMIGNVYPDEVIDSR